MGKDFNTGIKKVCQHCNSFIESKYDLLTCPKCKSPYHIECWYMNNGCVNKSCGYKVIVSQNFVSSLIDIEDSLINIEYLINNNRFIDAINECRRVLEVDKNNLKAKEFFNKAISCINIKMKLIESGDASLTNEDLESAELYYSRALDYADKSESDLLRTKLYVIKEKYPKLLKRRKKSKFIINLVGLLVVLVLGFLLFYNLHLKEHLEYTQLTKNDNYDNLVFMEQQVKYYENFISKYKEGELVNSAKGKINTLCFYIIENLYKDNWRSALTYFKKIDSTYNPVIFAGLKEKIYNSVSAEANNLILQFNKYYNNGDLNSAREILYRISEISGFFPNTELEEREKILQTKIDKEGKQSKKRNKLLDLYKLE